MNILKGIWNFMFDPNFGMGEPAYDLADGYKCTKHSNKTDPRQPHAHVWDYHDTVRHNWTVLGGKPVGVLKYPLDKVIDAIKENPGHTETKLEIVQGWKDSGYEFCFVSWTIYKCRVCGVKKPCEAYTAPIKADGTGPVVYDNHTTVYTPHKETTRIPVITGRREVAVERMKRYS